MKPKKRTPKQLEKAIIKSYKDLWKAREKVTHNLTEMSILFPFMHKKELPKMSDKRLGELTSFYFSLTMKLHGYSTSYRGFHEDSQKMYHLLDQERLKRKKA